MPKKKNKQKKQTNTDDIHDYMKLNVFQTIIVIVIQKNPRL